MKLYTYLRKRLSKADAVMITSLWYAVMITLVFIGLSQTGIDLRYANM